MKINEIENKLKSKSIYFSNQNIESYPAVVGYEKLFKWRWVATQLNTFIVAIDLNETEATIDEMKTLLDKSFSIAQENYTGWPRGLQSGIAVITILISNNVRPDLIDYCQSLSSGKKWAAFTIPVAIDSTTNQLHIFNKNPMWGRIYYPHIKGLINEIT